MWNVGDEFAGVFLWVIRWYRRVDLNHRPLVPQTSALTN